MEWFGLRSARVRLDGLELRIAALEARISSASDILEATERMDRVIKRSFRLNKQIDLLEGKKEASGALAPTALSRGDLLKMARGGA